MKTAKILLLAGLTGFLTDNLSLAQTWTPTSAPSNFWAAVASSANGAKLVATTFDGDIYVSADSGKTWTQTGAPANYWFSVASAADGTKLAAASDGSICVSTNSGATWMPTAAPNMAWCSIAYSADGGKLIAAALTDGSHDTGMVCVSTNFGADWISNSPNDDGLFSVASSADGNKLIAAGTPGVWFSTNSGVTWMLDNASPEIQTPVPQIDDRPLKVIASSADGNKLVLAQIMDSKGNPGCIYTSTNSGGSWQLTTAPSNYWNCVASSADGNILLAADLSDFGSVFVSTNSGATWATNNSPIMEWGGVAVSADGGKLFATALCDTNFNMGGIYSARLTRRHSLNIAQTNGDLALSWLVPSTNFVLQQSADLSSWSDVTNVPALNLTNLQNEVSLPSSSGNGFFRLKTP